MFPKGRWGAFVNTLTLAEASRDETARQALHRVARQEKAEVLTRQTARAGIAPTTETIADGVRGAPIEAAENLIIIEYRYLREVVSAILAALQARSPKRSGRYAASFAILADGVEISGPLAIQHDTREVVIVNTQPYARRLEIGKSQDGSPFVVQVPDRIVTNVALEARARFANFVRIRPTFLALDGGYSLTQGTKGRYVAYSQDRRSAGARAGKAGRHLGGSKAGTVMRYPGMRITTR